MIARTFQFRHGSETRSNVRKWWVSAVPSRSRTCPSGMPDNPLFPSLGTLLPFPCKSQVSTGSLLFKWLTSSRILVFVVYRFRPKWFYSHLACTFRKIWLYNPKSTEMQKFRLNYDSRSKCIIFFFYLQSIFIKIYYLCLIN